MITSEVDFLRKYEIWLDWHRENPKVWGYFKKFSLEAAHSGRKHISHWLIVNRIRWEVSITTTGHDFKISNNHIAFYARLWKVAYPDFRNIFTTKMMKGEIEVNYMEAL